jgi:hypothetical protein
MAIINSFPIGTPKTNDLLVGTSMPNVNTDADPITKNFSVSDVIALVPYRGTVESVGLSVGGDAVVVSNSPVTSTGILDISWIGDSSQYVNGKGILKTFPDIPFTSLNTDGTSGAATLVGGILNIPNYTSTVYRVTAGTNVAVSPTVGDVVVSAPNAIVNTTDTFGGPTVINIVCLTSAQYPPATVDGNTLYVII